MRLSNKLLGQGYVKERLKSSMVGTGILPNNMRSPLPNVTRPSGWWPYTLTPSIDRTLHQYQVLTVSDRDLITGFDPLPNYVMFTQNICNGCSMPTEDPYSSRHLVLSHFRSCMCSNVETNLSLTCLVSGHLSFEHPSVLLLLFRWTYLSDRYIYNTQWNIQVCGQFTTDLELRQLI